MAEIIIQINGQQVTPATVTNPLHAIIVKQMAEQLQQKLSRIVCPEHQAAPLVTIDIVGNKQHIAIAGCCQSLIDRTTTALTKLA